MRNRAKIVSVVGVAVAAGVVVAGVSATTGALFSDTATGGDSVAGAATVVLGRGGGSVALGYKDLKPGDRQVVRLTVSYQGSVPADVALEIRPSEPSGLCVQVGKQWQSRPGGAVTVQVDSADPVSYCDLLNGGSLPLASAMPPRSDRTIKVAVRLSEDANDNLRRRAVMDVATVRASGGFTDHVTGTIEITTAGHDKDQGRDQRKDTRTGNDAAAQPNPERPTIPDSTPGSPAPGLPPTALPVTLPAECERAGMQLDSFEDVIVLGPGQHTWKALDQRGLGAGPFLVIGSDGDDEIVGSDGADCIVGGPGRDKLAGGAGDDVLIAGAEVDVLDGGPGNDWLVGGSGVDELRGGEGIDRFDAGPDGAFCDNVQDGARATGCQAPTPPISSGPTDGDKDRSTEGTTSPPTTDAPAPPSPPETTSSPAASSDETSSPTTTAAELYSAGSAPPSDPTVQSDLPSDGTANPSTASGAGEDPSAERASSPA